MGSIHDWTVSKSPVTDQLVYQVAKSIVDNIKESGSTWTGTIHEIMDENGETDREEYGTYLRAIEQACKTYNIQWEKAGRNGRTYNIGQAALAAFLSKNISFTKKHVATSTVTITCPCCNTPIEYEINLLPVSR